MPSLAVGEQNRLPDGCSPGTVARLTDPL